LGTAGVAARVLFILKSYIYVLEIVLFHLSVIEFKVYFLFDWVALRFISIVFIISGNVILYREEYIEGDPWSKKFIYLVLLFVFSIFLIILRPNIVRIIVG